MGAVEFSNLKKSQKNGRSHDVTLFIRKDDKFIVIAKHFYPPGLFRAPSGGVEFGEDFVSGSEREALEETGCKVSLQKYILRIDVAFYHRSEIVDWVSHVFVADYVSGDLSPQDTDEIREVRVAGIEEFFRFKAMMLASSSGGLHYRAFLQDEAMAIMGIANLH
jgi:8-oxo-dGTP pyrophosphatase MutT (NUDIX family)